MSRFCAVLAVVALFAAGCGGDDDEGATTATTGGGQAGAQSVTVEVDGKVGDLPMGAIAYFPEAVTLHPGDTVRFHSNHTGEPHTVTFGTVVDESMKAFNQLPDEIKNADEPPDPSKLTDEQKAQVAEVGALDEALPTLLPEGAGDANQLSANPCYAATAPADTEKACPTAQQPAFDGRLAVYNSGFLPKGEVFEVELADDLAPGTYNYFCLLHREGMTGTITVVPEGQKAQTAEEVQQAAEKGLEETAAQLRPQFEQLEETPADTPIAGQPPAEGEEEKGSGFLAPLSPEKMSVPVGTSVTWSVFGPHTVSFNAPEDARGIMVRALDGTWHANQKATAPAGGPGAPPPPEGEPAPDAKPILVDGGTFDGSGFKSSGLILSFGPPGYQYKVTFTKAGTYKVHCLIHPDMEGTVKVT